MLALVGVRLHSEGAALGVLRGGLDVSLRPDFSAIARI
jgi:hypothetical protein